METAANDAQIFPQNFQKSRKLLNLRNANNSIGNDGNSGTNNGKKTSAKKKFENRCIPREVVLFYGNFGKNCSIRYWKLPKIQTGCLAWMEGAKLFSGQTTYLNYECTAVRPGWKRIATLNKMRHVFQGCPVSSKNDQEPIMLCFFLIESLGVFLVEFQRDDWNHYLGRVPLTLCRKKNK